MPIPTVEKIVEEFKQTNIYQTARVSGYGRKMEDWLRTTLTTLQAKHAEVEKARTTLHTSLVAAVEGKRKVENVTSHVETHDNFIVRNSECVGYNQALNDTLTIINSIFKE